MKLTAIYRRLIKEHIIASLSLLTTLEGVVSLFFLLSLPKSSNNSWLFGYSLNRIVLIAGMLLVNLALIWCTVNVLRKPKWEQVLFSRLNDLAAHDRLSAQVLTALSAGFIFIVFLLILWGITSDAYYLAYLIRFGPVIVFGTLIIMQLLIVFLSRIPTPKRTIWLWSLFSVSILIFLQEWPLIQFNKLGNIFLVLTMLFATFYAQALIRHWIQMSIKEQFGSLISIVFVGLFLYMEFFFIPKKFLIYRQSFFIFSPMVLLGLIVSVHLINRFLSFISRNATMRIVAYLIVIGGLIYAGTLYYFAGKAQSEQINITFAPRDDELAYMDFAIKVNQTNFQYTGTRNQMPVYPYVQALFYKPDMSLDDFFVLGKQINIILSLVSLLVIFLVVQRFLPLYQSVNLTLLTAFGLYVFKSGYFMSELLYYTLGALAYLLLCALLIRPSIKLGIGAGVVLGIAHLTKASVLPALLLFIGVFISKELFALYFRWKNGLLNIEKEKSDLKVELVSLLLVMICFLSVISPYIIESKKNYGSYFYNVNSTFYMWNDSWEEALKGTIAHGDLEGWPDMPPEEIPSAIKYFQEHNLSQIMARIKYGIHWQLENLRYQYGFFNYPAVFLGFIIVFFLIDLKENLQLAKRYFPLLAFAVLYFVTYIGLYIWYSPISNLPRFIYALYIPFLLSAFIGTQKLSSKVSLPLIKS